MTANIFKNADRCNLSQSVQVSTTHLRQISLLSHTWLLICFILVILLYKSKAAEHLCHFTVKFALNLQRYLCRNL